MAKPASSGWRWPTPAAGARITAAKGSSVRVERISTVAIRDAADRCGDGCDRLQQRPLALSLQPSGLEGQWDIPARPATLSRCPSARRWDWPGSFKCISDISARCTATSRCLYQYVQPCRLRRLEREEVATSMQRKGVVTPMHLESWYQESGPGLVLGRQLRATGARRKPAGAPKPAGNR